MTERPGCAEIEAAATRALDACRAAGLKTTTAESCTGGLIVGALTDIAGSSDVVGRGFVAYSNDAKIEMLGVAAATLAAHGAISEQAVKEMTAGALKAAGADADIAVAVSGFAGPGGGAPDKPVGTVWVAIQRKGHPAEAERHVFSGDRAAVRAKAVLRALEMIAAAAK